MWLSNHTARSGGAAGARAGVGKVTVPGENTAVLLAGEQRELSVLAPAGLHWYPAAGTPVLELETGDGERFILGTAESPAGLQQGEVRLTGDLHITGRLFLNGREILPTEGEE